jgi:hypothetical protein
MPQPINYNIDVANPIAMALQGYQVGAGIRQNRQEQEYIVQQRQQQQAMIDEQKARAEQVQIYMADFADLVKTRNVTAEDVMSAQLLMPEVADQVKSVWDTLSKERQQGSITDLSRLAIAFTRNPEIAKGMLDERIIAAENSGDAQQAATMKAIRGQADIDPDAPLSSILMQLATVMDKDQFANFMKVAVPEDKEAASLEGKIIQDMRAGLLTEEQAREAMFKARSPQTVVNVGGEEGEYAKALGKGQAEAVLAVSAQGAVARRNRNTLLELQGTLAASPAGMEAGLKSALGNFGIDTKGLSNIQAAEALIAQLVPTQRPPGSGTMSDRDLELYKKSLPRLINQPGGNEKIVKTTLAINEYLIKEADIADQVIDGTLTREEGRQRMAELINPLQEFKAKPKAKGGLPVVISDEDFDALEPGTEFIDENGSRYRKP